VTWRPGSTLRPGSTTRPAMESNFTILELPTPTPGIVLVEGLIGSVYLERLKDLKRYREIFSHSSPWR
jgi:hypothetical protein